MLTYSQIIERKSQIASRIPMQYCSGRSWQPIGGRRVLSLGCGPVGGEQFKELLAAAACVEGVDTDPLSGARYRSLTEVPVGEFDALVAEHVIEHMTHEGMLEAFEQTARILPSGGVVIITIPNIANFGGWFNNYDHRNFAPPDDIAAILELHGFRVEALFGWSKPSRFQRHATMSDEERALCRFMEDNWGLTLPQYITIGAIRVEDQAP